MHRFLDRERTTELYPRIRVKIFAPGNKKFTTRIGRAGDKRGFNSEQIDERLDAYADWILRRYPGYDYELVELSPCEFNFVHREEGYAEQRRKESSESRTVASVESAA